MPLNTVIERDGKVLKMPKGWGGFHLMSMLYAVSWDSGKGCFEDNTEPAMETPELTDGSGYGPEGHYVNGYHSAMIHYGHIAATALNDGNYTLKKDYTFVDSADGEILELKAGDVLKAWRGP